MPTQNNRVTLAGIQRRGLAFWKAREHWSGRKVRIWSGEHGAWWRPERAGYTTHLEAAGIYDFADAWDSTKHCDRSKKIVFEAI